MFFFRERKALENQYYEWIKENEIADQPNSVMAFLDIHGIINHKKAREKARVNKPYSKTNFDRITESVENLAAFINRVAGCCNDDGDCANCPLYNGKDWCSIKTIFEWLQKEIEE
jgi:hypothetical protein